MPAFDLAKEMVEAEKAANLKTMKFAHSFEVSLTPDNSGEWCQIDGYRVWQLTIKSEDAYSLNVIFSKYYIPDGARLFVFDSNRNVVLGAFTSANNKPYKKLAIYPVPGNELVIQYEEPENATFQGELEIGEVNHDFKGVFSLTNRWDRRLSESCNVDVNCEFESGLTNQKRAVCRVIAGDELGTGNLLNDVPRDGTPYLISAFHVFDDSVTAEVALYDFNYESPFCTGLDGSDVQSVSGSTAMASFDSIDFILVKLSEMPPPSYRPYLAGWDATNNSPFNSYIIHHPNGDTKKISHDTGTCDSIRYNREFINYGHWDVYNWETGSTEGGSSGGGLFNNNKRLVGTLSGGNASCTDPSFDLFARFDKMWNYRKEPWKQLKKWLDPANRGILAIDGLDPYAQPDSQCTMFSNFMSEDSAMVLSAGSSSEGNYTGNNSAGITEIAEKIQGYDMTDINGISLGIERIKMILDNPQLTIRVYTGDSIPQFAVRQFKYSMKNLTAGAMNFLAFPETVTVEGTFFISVVIPDSDTLEIYQSGLRPLIVNNSILYKKDGLWKTYNEITGTQNTSASMLMEILVCNSTASSKIDTIPHDPDLLIFKAFPNPASSYLLVEFFEQAPSFDFSMYDMAGRLIMNDCFKGRLYSEIDVSGLQPGIYLLRVSDGSASDTKRIIINH